MRRKAASPAPTPTTVAAEALRYSAILVTLAAELNASGGNPGEGLIATIVEHMAPITADTDLTEMVLLNLAARVAYDVTLDAERQGLSFNDLWGPEALAIAEALACL
jgi:hypothetical protein